MAADKKLPVVKDAPAAKPKPSPRAAGWGAFTDGGAAPRACPAPSNVAAYSSPMWELRW